MEPIYYCTIGESQNQVPCNLYTEKDRNIIHVHTVDMRGPNGPINAGQLDELEGDGITCEKRRGISRDSVFVACEEKSSMDFEWIEPLGDTRRAKSTRNKKKRENYTTKRK